MHQEKQEQQQLLNSTVAFHLLSQYFFFFFDHLEATYNFIFTISTHNLIVSPTRQSILDTHTQILAKKIPN